MRPIAKLAGIALSLAVAAGAMGCSAQTVPNAGAGITVGATATVEVVPDIAGISVSVATHAKSAPAAQEQHVEDVDAILTCLRELGIDDKDIQTVYTDVSPYWNDEGTEDGYEARTNLSVDGIAVEEVGAVMEACVDAGATEVSGPDYHTTSYEDAYAEALSKAIEATRPKAESMAQASGVKLGKVVAVTEGYQDTYLAYEESAKTMADTTDAGGVEIAPGEVSVEAQVTVTYAID